MKNIFDTKVVAETIQRINNLQPSSQAQWGKMNVAQMLAHCNVTYELVFDNIHPVPNAFVKFLLTLFVKKTVVTEKPYAKNSKTATHFLIVNEKNFELERQRLIQYVQKVAKLGANHFEGKASHSFGKLSSQEWNNMFYKHLDHHLKQFGV